MHPRLQLHQSLSEKELWICIRNQVEAALGPASRVCLRKMVCLRTATWRRPLQKHPHTPCYSGASWLLAPYGQRNCLLASIRQKDTHGIQTTSKLSTQRVPGLSLSLVVMLSQLNDQPFGIPLSLPQCYSMTYDRAEEQNSCVESMLV